MTTCKELAQLVWRTLAKLLLDADATTSLRHTMVVNVGDRVETYDGHKGTVVKKYFVTGQCEMYVHIKETDGRIWYCPVSCISRKDVKLNEETVERELAELLRCNAPEISTMLIEGMLRNNRD